MKVAVDVVSGEGCFCFRGNPLLMVLQRRQRLCPHMEEGTEVGKQLSEASFIRTSIPFVRV
jgi:hypothetical protein